MSSKDLDITLIEGSREQVIKGWTPLCHGFRAWELADRSNGTAKFHFKFLYHLSVLRMTCGHALIVNSCCRTPEHNKNEKGHPRSLHLTENLVHPTKGTMAIDFNVSGWHNTTLDDFITVAKELGWSVGHGYELSGYGGAYSDCEDGSFIHLDRRIDIGLKQIDFWYS